MLNEGFFDFACTPFEDLRGIFSFADPVWFCIVSV